jgi:hypothetical protein
VGQERAPTNRRSDAEIRHAFAELDLIRERLDLWFWAARMMLALIAMLTMTVALMVTLIDGGALSIEQMAVGAAITGAGAASARLRSLALARARRSTPSESPSGASAQGDAERQQQE